MTAKEKARELYSKYWLIVDTLSVKKCVLILIDEILNNNNGSLEYESDIEYWKEVKKEIKNL